MAMGRPEEGSVGVHVDAEARGMGRRGWCVEEEFDSTGAQGEGEDVDGSRQSYLAKRTLNGCRVGCLEMMCEMQIARARGNFPHDVQVRVWQEGPGLGDLSDLISAGWLAVLRSRFRQELPCALGVPGVVPC